MEKSYPKELDQGINLFNQGEYYQAHEYFEDAWRITSDPSREFYRALLQISGGFFRLRKGNPSAAHKFFSHALKWLEPFPDQHLEIDTATLKEDIRIIITAIDEGETHLDELLEILHPLIIKR